MKSLTMSDDLQFAESAQIKLYSTGLCMLSFKVKVRSSRNKYKFKIIKLHYMAVIHTDYYQYCLYSIVPVPVLVTLIVIPLLYTS